MEELELKAGLKLEGMVQPATIKLGDQYCLELKTEEFPEYRFIIPQSEIDIIFRPNIEDYFGKLMSFIVKDIDYKNRLVLASRKDNIEKKRNFLIKELEEGKEITAKVNKVGGFGAYLRHNEVPLILRNKDFSTDYTSVADVLNVGDVINCKLVEVSPTKRIFIEPVPKYVSVKETREFAVGEKIAGTITTITAFGYFVRIADGIDILCPIDGFEFNKRDMAIVEIKQVKEDGRLRGKILKPYNEDVRVQLNIDELPEE